MKAPFYFILLLVLPFLLSCGGGKSDSENIANDSTKTEEKAEKPTSISMVVIDSISEKMYIPVDESKSDYIFTINKNLNLQLVNYTGSYEGKYVDGKVQFDDKNSTIIDFTLKDKNVVLTNQNNIAVECKLADDQKLLSGTWTYIYKYPDKDKTCTMIIDSKGNWSCPDRAWPAKGQYTKQSDKIYSLPKYVDQQTGTLTMNSANNCVVAWKDFLTEKTKSHVLSRFQKGKMESLNQIFN